jgi:hypothetical protein
MPCLNTIRGILQEVVSLEELEEKASQYLYRRAPKTGGKFDITEGDWRWISPACL